MIGLLLSLAAAAQDDRSRAAADFRKVNEAFTAKAFGMDITYTLFGSYTSTKAAELQHGVFRKLGSSYYSELLGITTLRNDKVVVSVDKNEETIVVNNTPKQPSNKTVLNQLHLDSTLKICSSVTMSDLGRQRVYKLRFDRSSYFPYNAIDVHVNSKTFFIDKLTFYFREELDLDESDEQEAKDKPRLEIAYTNLDTDPGFSESQFSEKIFISVSGKKVTLSNAYRTYRLINQLTR